MPIGMKIMYAHSARIYAYGVGYGVAVWNERQYQSLCKRNSKIAVPLFVYISGTLSRIRFLYAYTFETVSIRFSLVSVSPV